MLTLLLRQVCNNMYSLTHQFRDEASTGDYEKGFLTGIQVPCITVAQFWVDMPEGHVLAIAKEAAHGRTWLFGVGLRTLFVSRAKI